ncbi:YeiH family protein [Effusibacillus pohliae]|uniref:YeiH family protein n=1 Tax=Effusibacillus pohliae TaxID=232270 RepID=UPI0003699D25
MQHTVLFLKKKKPLQIGMVQGICLTLLLAVAAKVLVGFPFLSILGQLVIAILLGMSWRTVMGIPETAASGISFAGKHLLRIGIILLGMRLNLSDIAQAGPKVLALACVNLVFTIFSVYWISKWFQVEKRLALLSAVGTAICGAAAVAAIAPQLKSKQDEIAVGVASVAILGTIFTVAYTLLYPLLGLNDVAFGIFAGATLHEVAHVVAAAAPVSAAAVDMAVIVKLTRVALLIPVALLIGIIVSRSEWSAGDDRTKDGDRTRGGDQGDRPQRRNLAQRGDLTEPGKRRDRTVLRTLKDLPIPWFIVGFLVMSAVNTLGIFSQQTAASVVNLAYFLIAMAMAGLGLNVDVSVLRRWGARTIAGGFIGSLLLSVLGFVLVKAFRL